MAILSKDEQYFYKGTMKKILIHLNEFEKNKADEKYVCDNWTTWIAAAIRHSSFADQRKTLQLLKQLELEGKVTKRKNALNHYVWSITDVGKQYLEQENNN